LIGVNLKSLKFFGVVTAGIVALAGTVFAETAPKGTDKDTMKYITDTMWTWHRAAQTAFTDYDRFAAAKHTDAEVQAKREDVRKIWNSAADTAAKALEKIPCEYAPDKTIDEAIEKEITSVVEGRVALEIQSVGQSKCKGDRKVTFTIKKVVPGHKK
jgi:hypothetical protein